MSGQKAADAQVRHAACGVILLPAEATDLSDVVGEAAPLWACLRALLCATSPGWAKPATSQRCESETRRQGGRA